MYPFLALKTLLIALAVITAGAFVFFPGSAHAVNAVYDGINLAGVDVDGDGVTEFGVMKNQSGDQNFYVYNSFTGTEQAVQRSADLWNIPSDNSVLATTGIDVNCDGVDEVAVLRNENGDHNIYFYATPNVGDQMMPLLSYDKWIAPSGDNVLDIAGVDANGDGIRNELLVLKQLSSDRVGLSVYSVPKYGAGYSVLLGSQEWSVNGSTILSVAGVDPDGAGDRVALLLNESGDVNVRLYSLPVGGAQSVEIGGDLWNIPTGNDVVDIERVNVNGDALDELAVVRKDQGDLNFYVFTTPNGYEQARQISADYWNIPGDVSMGTYSLGKTIEVNLAEQRLYAKENGVVVNTFFISSGIARLPSPRGEFAILEKIPVKRYQWTYGPGNPNNYNLPNVKWNMRFHGPFYLHGAYWHNNFGHPMSHGCINISYTNAEWLYNWSSVGTPVTIY